jgi:hypothetical protein
VNFATALADANYSAVSMAGSGTTPTATVCIGPVSAIPTTTAFRFVVSNIVSGNAEGAYTNFIAFGN